MSSINNLDGNNENQNSPDKNEQIDHMMSPFNKRAKERALTSNKNEEFSLKQSNGIHDSLTKNDNGIKSKLQLTSYKEK